MKVVLLNGLGSRVLILTKCLSAETVPEIEWARGEECPCYYEKVFPNGIEGLSMFNSEAGNRYGFLLNLKIDESKFADNVKKIFRSMELPEVVKHELGVIYRSHFGKKTPDADFYRQLQVAMEETTGDIPTVCDSKRAEVLQFLGERGIPQTSHDMQFDLDRSEDNVRPYLEEWWRVLNCRRVVTNNPGSTTIWPHQFLG